MHLSKYHGLGNDFLVAFADAVPADASELARRVCHRTRGVGADGLVIGTALAGDGDTIRARFTLFNSDGSAAEVSGNGLRCFGHAVARRCGRDHAVVVAATAAGPRRIEVDVAPGGTDATARVGMGPMSPLPVGAERGRRIGELVGALDIAAPVVQWDTADMGNPHLVLQVTDADAVDPAVVGPLLEAEFAADHGGINVHLVTARPGGDGIDLRVWERGVGVTEACGSGACAAGAMAIRWGLVSGPVVVHMPGGSATVELTEGGIVLTGPSAHIAEVEMAP